MSQHKTEWTGEPTLIITRGYAGSGKSTRAQEWVRRTIDHAAASFEQAVADGGWWPDEHVPEERARRNYPPLPHTPRVRVNRDDLRAMLVNGSGVLSHEGEQMVTVAQKAQVRALLAAGVSVVVDDTNLRLRFARDWADLARDLGVEFFVWDFKADREQCISNDEKRAREGGRKVGTLAIADMAHRFPQPWPKVEARPVKDEHKALPYVADPDLPDAWVIDIDGTAAIKETGPDARGYYDWDRVGEDLPNPAVIQLVNQLSYYGDDLGRKVPQIIFLSGRKDETGEDGLTCFKRTQAWLEEHLDPHVAGRFELYLGAAGDSRDDRIVKAEMFDAHVRNRFNVIGVVDDRPKVCRMWREMGLNVLQVGDPHVEF